MEEGRKYSRFRMMQTEEEKWRKAEETVGLGMIETEERRRKAEDTVG